MSQYSSDGQGVIRFIDSNNTVLFDRTEAKVVPGWSKEKDIVDRWPGIVILESDGTVFD